MVLENLNISTLSKDHRDRLEAPITMEEVLEVIKNLKKNSAPGPNGFSIPYYKVFAPTLAPYLAKCINYKSNGCSAEFPSSQNLIGIQGK